MRQNASEQYQQQQRQAMDHKKKQHYQMPYYEDESTSTGSVPFEPQYDSLNNLLRNSEERAGKDLFEIGAKDGM